MSCGLGEHEEHRVEGCGEDGEVGNEEHEAEEDKKFSVGAGGS
jgi:hypothetical protein